MHVDTAFDMDGIQLFDYCQRNDLLRNLEISEIFGLKIPAKRTVRGKPPNLAESNTGPCSSRGQPALTDDYTACPAGTSFARRGGRPFAMKAATMSVERQAFGWRTAEC
jgi:hypothetical protein